MTEEHKDILESKRVILMSLMDLDNVMNHLRTMRALELRDVQKIEGATGLDAKVGVLLDILLRKQDAVFAQLLIALQSANQAFVARELQ